jgi:hypothetical protein
MTTEELEKLEALAGKATPGPVVVCAGQLVWGTEDGSGGWTCGGKGCDGLSVTTPTHEIVCETHERADAAFHAALVNAFPALVTQAKAAEKWRVYAQHLSGCDALLYLPSSGRADMPCTCGFRSLSAEEASHAR